MCRKSTSHSSVRWAEGGGGRARNGTARHLAPTVMTGLHLAPAPGIFVAALSPDLVLLDLATDDYICLAGVSSCLERAPDGRLLAATPALAREFMTTGLFVMAPEAGPPVETIVRPVRTTRTMEGARPRWNDRRDFALSLLHARRRFPGQPVRSLMDRATELRPNLRPGSDPVQRSVLFDRWLPWVPGQGQCLYRAFTLLDFLRRDGVDARWVFGVRTWPFGAHCWLQSGDLLLDDDLDRVSLYTPIMVV